MSVHIEFCKNCGHGNHRKEVHVEFTDRHGIKYISCQDMLHSDPMCTEHCGCKEFEVDPQFTIDIKDKNISSVDFGDGPILIKRS